MVEGFKLFLLYRTNVQCLSPHPMCKAVIGTKLPQFPFVVHTAFCITYSAAGMLLTNWIIEITEVCLPEQAVPP